MALVNRDAIRVMLVDDHVMLTQCLRAVLAHEPDIEVDAIAHSVADALATAPHVRPDVILMDYYLPDGDGVTATTHLRAADPNVKVLLLTGSDDPAALQRAVVAGCHGYLDKASELDDVAVAVRAAAAGHMVIGAEDVASLLVPRAGASSSHLALTRREIEILCAVADGLTNQAIADRLVLSVHTVRTHVQTILAKLGAHSKLEAVVIAKRRRLLR